MPEIQCGPKIGAWPSRAAAAFGSREEWVRPTLMPNTETSVVETVRSPVSRLTLPGPMSSLAAPSALRSTISLTGSAETVPPGPVKSARSCTVPSGLTVPAAFQLSAGVLPAVSATGQEPSAAPELVTSAGGTGAQASASERRQEKLALSYLEPSASAASGTRAAVREPSFGEVTPPAPTWKA